MIFRSFREEFQVWLFFWLVGWLVYINLLRTVLVREGGVWEHGQDDGLFFIFSQNSQQLSLLFKENNLLIPAVRCSNVLKALFIVPVVSSYKMYEIKKLIFSTKMKRNRSL